MSEGSLVRGRGRGRAHGAVSGDRSRSSSLHPDNTGSAGPGADSNVSNWLSSGFPNSTVTSNLNRRSIGSLSQLSGRSTNSSGSLGRRFSSSLSLSRPTSRESSIPEGSLLARGTSFSSSLSELEPTSPAIWSQEPEELDLPDPRSFIDNSLIAEHDLSESQISMLHKLVGVSILQSHSIRY